MAFPRRKVNQDNAVEKHTAHLFRSRFPKICSRLSFPEITAWTWRNGNAASESNVRFGMSC